MKLRFFTPYSQEKDLGKEYNEYMAMIGDDDVAVITDGDVMFLTPDFGSIIFNYACQNRDCVMTCWTNRIHRLAKEQLKYSDPVTGLALDDCDIEQEIVNADIISGTATATPVAGPLSGFLMVVPKSVWYKIPFREGIGLLGVDTWFYKDIRAVGIPVMRMDGLYVWHTYRLMYGVNNKQHLL